ncbi:hypothetical protein CW304_13565 [Bacillus sp. UFRGS-B20]|nr:hypothetical protein CW304_13565 [Bacillus sp. UFRGS-B20]
MVTVIDDDDRGSLFLFFIHLLNSEPVRYEAPKAKLLCAAKQKGTIRNPKPTYSAVVGGLASFLCRGKPPLRRVESPHLFLVLKIDIFVMMIKKT